MLPCEIEGKTQLLDGFVDQEHPCQRVGIAIAAHSKMLDPILDRFGDYLKSIKLNAPEIPIVSNRSAT